MEKNNTMEIDTKLGRRTIDTDKVINFPRGLPGFEEEREFTLLELRPDAPLLILQSINLPEAGLLVADPYSFLDSYPVVLDDEEQKLLNISSPDDAAILVTVTIPQGKPEGAMLNLTGPIIINHHTKLGIQILQDSGVPAQVSMHKR